MPIQEAVIIGSFKNLMILWALAWLLAIANVVGIIGFVISSFALSEAPAQKVKYI
jgi:hypothetical protein